MVKREKRSSKDETDKIPEEQEDKKSTKKISSTKTKREKRSSENDREEQENQQPPPKRYRLRSGAVGVPKSHDAIVKSTRRLNSSGDIKPKTKSGPKPFIDFKGTVEYYTTASDIEAACAKLFEWLEAQNDVEDIPIAFDMEWPFSFQTGSGRSAVIQLCAELNVCYVFHISQLKELPKSLLDVIYHPKVILNGVCIKNDLRKLQRDYPDVDSQRMVDRCVDLGPWCNAVCNTGGRWSMERLVMYLCQLQINKEGKVRRSKWDIQPLSPEQQIYAAIDVYISQVMYLELKQREEKKALKEAAILQEHGAKALAAIKQLE